MRLTLYSFKICPFVEKINILLNEKNIKCEKVYVNIRNKPDWFLKISPLGKVPTLMADDTIIFESNVIADFLDDISLPLSIHPANPAQKAHNKSWIEWGNTLIVNAYHMTLAENKTEFLEKKKMVDSKLMLLEKQLNNIPFFNGKKFSMIDISYAPLFRRFDSLIRQYSIDMLSQHKKLKDWSMNILNRLSVQNGFVHNFDEEFSELLKIKNSFLVSK